jgi:hypothetical protein
LRAHRQRFFQGGTAIFRIPAFDSSATLGAAGRIGAALGAMLAAAVWGHSAAAQTGVLSPLATKHPPATHTPVARQLIPPAVVLGPIPVPRPPLSIETDMMPVTGPEPASAQPKPPG